MPYLRHYFLSRISIFFCLIFGIYGSESLRKADVSKGKNIIFSSKIMQPASGKKPDSIVVLLHGYGDTSENFIFLGALLAECLPDSLFVAIEGPITCKTISYGKQWLSSSKNNPSQLLKEINKLTPSLNQYLDDLLETYQVPPEKLVILGFSQGARVALHIGLRRAKCAGIIAFSGSYLNDATAVNLSSPPILLIHGEADKKAPPSLAKESYKQLEALKMPVTLILLPKVEHEIVPQGVAIAGEFLKACLENKKDN